MKRIIAIALVAIMVLVVFASCGGSSDAAGKYTVKSVNGKSVEDAIKESLGEYGEGLDIDTILSLAGIDSLEDYMTMELKSDGTVESSMAGVSQTGTWSQSGNTVTITIDGDAQEFSFNGTELSASAEGIDYVFVRK